MAKTFMVEATKTDHLKGDEESLVYGYGAQTEAHFYIVFVERDGSLTPCCDGVACPDREVRKSRAFRDLLTYTHVNKDRILAKYAREAELAQETGE